MATITVKSKIIVRNDTDANWVSANPVLLKGEAGYCTDKLCLKFGDGSTKWNDLPKFGGQSVIIQSTAPSDGSQHTYEEGTFWIDLSASSPEIYILIQRESDNREWLQLITAEALAAKGAMLAKDFAKESEAGAKTGYVDKALMADKLKTARTIALTGGVGGSASFDGSGNISIATTLSITENDVPSLPLYKIRDAGTAASRNVGTTAGQVPILDASGKLNTSVLPQLAIVDVVEAASDAEMLAKTVQKGDICLRSDAPAGAFILAGNDPKELANWKRIPVPANAVLSVNGKVGVITLTTDDIAEGSRLYFTPARLTSYLQDANNTFIMDGGNA